MTVYVLFRGEDHEGGDIDSIYDSFEKALVAFNVEADALINPERPRRNTERRVNIKNKEAYAHAGCDYITILEFNVN